MEMGVEGGTREIRWRCNNDGYLNAVSMRGRVKEAFSRTKELVGKHLCARHVVHIRGHSSFLASVAQPFS